ncbi:hypothetical protein BJ138DRAFT_1148727 [Hygrophoropsis aurantiaca]|uniref:Uncharacterized protein n=1 Tax=Hygrophoropsis aurantiaca TaxID=72124 RepID=A0ACB8AFY9_9AGAM|nr:hypothetical protein BJ138DRAFT_1148727 [Hygrophoropsis aurantiaca]
MIFQSIIVFLLAAVATCVAASEASENCGKLIAIPPKYNYVLELYGQIDCGYSGPTFTQTIQGSISPHQRICRGISSEFTKRGAIKSFTFRMNKKGHMAYLYTNSDCTGGYLALLPDLGVGKASALKNWNKNAWKSVGFTDYGAGPSNSTSV